MNGAMERCIEKWLKYLMNFILMSLWVPETIGKTPKKRGHPKGRRNMTKSQDEEMKSEKTNLMSRLLEANEAPTSISFDSWGRKSVCLQVNNVRHSEREL